MFHFAVVLFFLTQALSAEIGFGQNLAAQPHFPSLLIVLGQHFGPVLFQVWAQLTQLPGWFCFESAPSQHSRTVI